MVAYTSSVDISAGLRQECAYCLDQAMRIATSSMRLRYHTHTLVHVNPRATWRSVSPACHVHLQRKLPCSSLIPLWHSNEASSNVI